MAQLLNIWTKPAKGEQMVSHESIECITGEGLQGCVGGKADHRQVTILSLAAWNEAQQEIGEQMDPIYRRANLLVDEWGPSVPQSHVVLHSMQPGREW